MNRSSFQMSSLSFSGLKELKNRFIFMLAALIVYRIGAHIPIPGLDLERLAILFSQTGSGLMAHFNMISGGALSQCTLFAVGLGPYITSSIIIQMLSHLVPSLEKLKKEGELGRRRINQYTRYLTVILAAFYSFALTKYIVSHGVATDPTVKFYVLSMITLIAGAVFLMWLGEQITARGIGNGTSLIIFSGIVSTLPVSIVQLIEQVRQGQVSIPNLLIIIIIIGIATGFVVFVERAQRKLIVNYPKRQQGRHVYAAQSSHLPFKINMTGIMPTIFASSIMIAPSILLNWLGIIEKYPLLKSIGLLLSRGQPLYMLTLACVIAFFCFFYTALAFDPRETADNLKKSGAFLPGIRPGVQSAQYIDMIMTRLTTIGCVYLILVVLLPDLLVMGLNVPFMFGGTSLLIVVVVVMELITQIQTLLMSHQYESLLRKARLKR